MEQLIQSSIQYLNDNKKTFLEEYTRNIVPLDEKIVIFTAGMSGVGKTEFAIYLKESYNNLLHIDTDAIREFFRPIGYNGQNSDTFQKASSRGFNELFNYAMKQNYSMILDSNFSSLSQAIQNIERLLRRDYKVEIYYLYNHPKICFEYAIRREVVTHRKVPKDVFVKSNEDSYKTILEIKNMFKEKVTLNFFDKREERYYEDIDTNLLIKKIGAEFEA